MPSSMGSFLHVLAASTPSQPGYCIGVFIFSSAPCYIMDYEKRKRILVRFQEQTACAIYAASALLCQRAGATDLLSPFLPAHGDALFRWDSASNAEAD